MDVKFKEAMGLKRRLKNLEREVRRLRADLSGKESVKKKEWKKGKAKSLDVTFTNQPNTMKGLWRRQGKSHKFIKSFRLIWELFVNHLYKEGYFNNANFLPGNKLEFSCFESKYGQEFIKFAAEKFAKDNQEIAK